MTKILWATAVGLLVLAFALIIWDSNSTSGSDGAVTSGGTDQVVEHIDDTDEGDVAAGDSDGGIVDGGDEAVAHVDSGDGQEAVTSQDVANADEGGNAYLETAPKDSLALVAMTNFAFTPDTLEVNAGEVLEITIQNVESAIHDFTIDEIDADVHISYLGGTGQHAHAMSGNDADVHFALTEPGSGVVHLKGLEPGEYVFYCSVPGHRESGMEGKLIIR